MYGVLFKEKKEEKNKFSAKVEEFSQKKEQLVECLFKQFNPSAFSVNEDCTKYIPKLNVARKS